MFVIAWNELRKIVIYQTIKKSRIVKINIRYNFKLLQRFLQDQETTNHFSAQFVLSSPTHILFKDLQQDTKQCKQHLGIYLGI